MEQEGITFYPITINNKGTHPYEDLKLMLTYLKLYQKLKPDVVLHYTVKPNIYATLAAAIVGIPVVSNISGLGTVFLNDKLSSKVARVLYKIALRYPKKVFFQNPHDLELFVHKKLVSEKVAGLLPGSGIDTNKYIPIEVEKEKDKAFVFLLIARLIKDKGIIEYIEAAKMIKTKFSNVKFQLLGSFYPGNPTAISKEEVERWEYENIVEYIGYSDDVMSWISQSDCVVLPSYREGLSRVLLEAASMAKPIITTDTPGCKDVVDHEVTGYLCEVKNAQCLAAQMEKKLQLTHAERVEMGKKGRQKVIVEFSEEIVIRKYLEIINEITQSQIEKTS